MVCGYIIYTVFLGAFSHSNGSCSEWALDEFLHGQ